MLRVVEKIYNNLVGSVTKKNVEFKLDQETIEKIGAIVLEIVALFQSCKKTPEEAVQVAHNPGVGDKRRMRRVVRKELGLFKYLREGGEYYDAVLKTGYDLTLDDMVEAYRG